MRTKLVLVLICLVVSSHVHTSSADEASEVEAGEEAGEEAGQDQASQASSQDAAQNQAVADTAASAAAETVNSANPANNDVDTSGAQAGETAENDQDENNEEDDADNIKGMSESLADSMAESMADLINGLLKSSTNTSEEQEGADAGSGGNATQGNAAASAAAAATGEGEAGSSMTPQEAGEGADQSAGSTAGQAGSPQAAEPKVPPSGTGSDEDADKFGDHGDNEGGNDQWSSTETFGSSTQPGQPRKEVDCSAEVDLKDYCTFTPMANDYFHNDTTLRGLRAPFINMDIVHRLMSCRRGEWCLGDELDVFRNMQGNFNGGPLCDDDMWECIFDVMVLRENCPNDKEFMFVVDDMDLLCSLSDVNAEAPGSDDFERQGGKCFAHMLAALHVTYADFLANDMADFPPETDVTCQGHGFRMSLTYLCADDFCKNQYDARLAMEKWREWSWFMTNVAETVERCQEDIPENVCGSLEPEGFAPKPTGWFGMSTTARPLWSTSTSSPTELGRFGQEDESLMVALSVATAVALLFMVMGLIFFLRRSRRRSAYYYRTVSDSYDKELGDEARLLSRAAND